MKTSHKSIFILICTMLALPIGSRIFQNGGVLFLLGVGVLFGVLVTFLADFIEKKKKRKADQ